MFFTNVARTTVQRLEAEPELLIENVNAALAGGLDDYQLNVLKQILENTNYEMIKDLLYKVD